MIGQQAGRLSPISAVVAFSCRRPVAVALFAALLCVFAILFIGNRFAMTTDTAELISPEVEWRQQEAALDAAFPQQGDLTLIVIDGATPELAEAGTARLAASLASRPDMFRTVRRPEGGTFFANQGLLFGSVSDVRATTEQLIAAQPFLGPLAADPSVRGVMTSLSTMVDGVAQGQAKLTDIAQPVRALGDALEKVNGGEPGFFSWQNLFASGEGRLKPPVRRFILIQPRLDYGALTPGEGASEAIRQTAGALQLDPAHGVNVRLTGPVPLSDEEFASLTHRVWLVTSAMVGSMLLMLWLATRSARMVTAIMLTTIAGLVVTTAIGLFAVGQFNLISVAFIPLFVGLGVDSGIQISVRFREERLTETGAKQALVRAAGALGGPLALAAGAICLGFFAFMPTSYVGISELGIIAGLGMIVALAFSLTLLPALVILSRPPEQKLAVGSRSMAPLDRFLVERRQLVLWAFGLSMIVSIALLPLVKFDFNPFHLRDQNGEAMATLIDLMRDPEQTPNTVDVLAPNVPAAITLARKLEALPEVAQAVTVASFVPEDQREKLALIDDARTLLDFTLNPFDVMPPPTLAENRASIRETSAKLRALAGTIGGKDAADALRLAKQLDALSAGPAAHVERAQTMLTVPLGVLLDQARAMLQAQPVALESLPPDLVRDWVTSEGRARIQVFPRGDTNDNGNLVRFAKAVRSVAPNASGPPISTQEAARTISYAFIQAGVIALVAITLLLFAVLRSVKEVAFTLAPVVLSGFLTLATCVLIGQPINFANIIAFPLLFGVGVAFHIYFVMAWRAGATDLLQSGLARAVLFSALATGAAFGSLWISAHPGTASMGKILMISLAWTLVCALIFEPALLGPPRGRKNEEPISP